MIVGALVLVEPVVGHRRHGLVGGQPVGGRLGDLSPGAGSVSGRSVSANWVQLLRRGLRRRRPPVGPRRRRAARRSPPRRRPTAPAPSRSTASSTIAPPMHDQPADEDDAVADDRQGDGQHDRPVRRRRHVDVLVGVGLLLGVDLLGRAHLDQARPSSVSTSSYLRWKNSSSACTCGMASKLCSFGGLVGHPLERAGVPRVERRLAASCGP